jgi:hypothetical protein
LYRVLCDGFAADKAFATMQSVWEPNAVWEHFIAAMLQQNSTADTVGLCERCVHSRRITSSRGSVFYLCDLSEVDSNFPKYPRLPVLRCRGFRETAVHEQNGRDALQPPQPPRKPRSTPSR